MTRKRFVKRLLANRVPRNTAVAVAEIVRTAHVPYSCVSVVLLRPWYDDYIIYITFDCHMRTLEFAERFKYMTDASKRELDKIVRKNKAKRASAEEPWLHLYPLSEKEVDRFLRPIQGTSSDKREFNIHQNYRIPSPEEVNYFEFKRKMFESPHGRQTPLLPESSSLLGR